MKPLTRSTLEAMSLAKIKEMEEREKQYLNGELKIIKVRLADSSICNCTIELSVASRCKILFSGLPLKKHKFYADDLFDALSKLRLELEKIKAQILCVGAREDVFPSSMSRDMGDGRLVYAYKIGLSVDTNILLDIFEHEDSELLCTVARQLAFHRRWFDVHFARDKEFSE